MPGRRTTEAAGNGRQSARLGRIGAWHVRMKFEQVFFLYLL